MASDEDIVTLFSKFGFGDAKSKEIIKNKKVSQQLYEILGDDLSSFSGELEPKKLALLHQLAIDLKGSENVSSSLRQLLTDAILDERIKSTLQVQEGVKYLKSTQSPTESELNTHAGVGQEVSEEQVHSTISKYFDSIMDELQAKRYTMVPSILGQLRKLTELKWASPALFKPIVDSLALKHLGPKDERDVIKKVKKTPAKASAPDANKKDSSATKVDAPVETERSMFSEGFLGDLHKPGENPQMWPELMDEHLKFTHRQVFTRFPPEPNGFLHIGHSKAIMVNFGYAAFNKGNCYLRFDDTNPEAEEEVYFKSIEDMVSWLGYSPWKITYSSDYFQELYDLAEKLIECDRGYVCHCTPEQVKEQRGMKADGTLGGQRNGCSHRERTPEENLKEFRKMRDGFYKTGEATLRMKQDYTSPNPQMWDLVAYRVLDAPHHRTGDKWKIYPTYDFTHCLVDSFENISHSLCTTEFRLLRESYEWLCDTLHVYRPAQREYGRLNITGTVLSKRKIAKLVTEGYVRGWDDPRLYTLEGIRRRGVPPGAILSFINTLGVTTSTTNIECVRFESAVRSYLDQTTPRLMVVLDPVLVEVDNLGEDETIEVEMPYKPGSNPVTLGPLSGGRTLKFGKYIYIDRSDVRDDDQVSKEYFRLAPGQPVGLMKVPFNISLRLIERDTEGNITKVLVNYDKDIKKKPKTYIQWIPKSDCIKIDEVRVQNALFTLENPKDYLAELNPNSEEIFGNAVIESSFKEIVSRSPMNVEIPGSQFNIKEKPGNNTVRFQALRVGYFCLDKDSNDDKLILNRIVTLKEDSSKK
ncbi:uncharacterized protein KQ657_003642 [Scheffersomyces spartinae]|uniref:glutamine--tRNA ligase n=1 Tax=Scheffersomyces spartinae TaxID=45513 RepID=A0A9P8AJT4_9ASCO|nr:uncharacterized protein KQ657_003642 [Scheffersomyces spartinae]KAG7195121.1 hypothetical protein KQ657_003642 [Scheffersomyces spartinae]